MAYRKLRIVALQVTPVVAWDDGSDLAPGPNLNMIVTSVGELPTLRAKLESDLERLTAENQIEGGEENGGDEECLTPTSSQPMENQETQDSNTS